MFGAKHVWRKPRRFGYIPRYYDPAKDAREECRYELLDELEDEVQSRDYKPGMYVRQQALRRRGHTQIHKKERSSTSRRRMLIMLIILAAVAVYILL